MRLSRRKPSPPLPTSPDLTSEIREADMTPPVPWSVEQLNALGPATGPSHRTFVPIVRSTLPDNSLGDLQNP